MSNPASGAPTVLLVDDHRLLRQAIRRSLKEAGFDVVGEADDGQEAVRLAEELRPVVILMDVTMPVLGGLEATRLLTSRVPESKVVMLSMHGDEDVIQEAMRAGAVGYLAKDCAMEEVAHALRIAASGEAVVSAELAGSMLAELTGPAEVGSEPVISKREEEVLQLFADGCSSTEVAAQLFISAKTVKNHLASIYEKLDARDRTHAVIKAVRMGIIRLE